uniref:Tr-type G domain-containing protein n=1 Tax=Chromera velia CCMP2878 TaxID=1169474 RepID=A0A0G4I3T8_9ALVE|eukprot:Cvel_10759.t1-p1 / transcript=Cvel_10759.t1 / gene=Cvel_10759 / organism=Chromera_velia_CCMP2878 / gene_product=Elongation factor Tu GTP-binding domain-containing, putative / transcript_product=Elongation factor Tu GTP-binding domain-containing, putative / location=Cvel_scaffold656:60494-73942(-) / protein_length=1345 / sequence_SO=supercontig / SO=protein_coding / is_pseudo=false
MDTILRLQEDAECIRNISILAHVDHGKTTLSDSLISSNGIISQKSAGKMRYLDSRGDEQERQITIKSSCISLHYSAPESSTAKNQKFLINLIDSPGHVDFSSEVATAVRLCDGAIVVVDAVEGISPQTRTVVRQAWKERLRLVLFINKMDRLFTDLGLSASEAYAHLQATVEQLNVYVKQLLAEETMAKAARLPEGETQGGWGSPSSSGGVKRTSSKTGSGGGEAGAKGKQEGGGSAAASDAFSLEYDDEEEEAFELSPANGRVIFGSALHGWGFSVSDMCAFVAPKLGVPRGSSAEEKLQVAMWGEYFLNPKARTVSRKQTGKLKPLFVQFVLEPIWKVFESTCPEIDEAAVQKIVKSLQVDKKVNLSKLEKGTGAANAILAAWLPLAPAVLRTVSLHLPSPVQAAPFRLPFLCPSLRAPGALASLLVRDGQAGEGGQAAVLPRLESLRCALFKSVSQKETALAEGSPLVVHVAKFLAADIEKQALTADRLVGTESVRDFVGFCRVFSGTLRVGDILFLCETMKEKTSERRGSAQVEARRRQHSRVRVAHLFVLMGRFLERAGRLCEGSIGAVALEERWTGGGGDGSNVFQAVSAAAGGGGREKGVEETGEEGEDGGPSSGLSSVDRCVTLSSEEVCPAFEIPYDKTTAAILRVTLQPRHLKDLDALIRGMHLLHKADPSVEVSMLDTGEHVIGCCGEIHLERCLKDLENLYARVPFSVSPPLVAVRETVVDCLPGEAETLGLADLSAALSKKVTFPPWASQLTPPPPPQFGVGFGQGGVREGGNEAAEGEGGEGEEGQRERETEQYEQEQASAGVVTVETANRVVGMRLRALRMPRRVLRWLDANAKEVEVVLRQRRAAPTFLPDSAGDGIGGGGASSSSVGGAAAEADFRFCLSEIQRNLESSWVSSPQGGEGEGEEGEEEEEEGEREKGGNRKLPGALLGVSAGRGSRNLLFFCGTGDWDKDRQREKEASVQALMMTDAEEKRRLWSLMDSYDLRAEGGVQSGGAGVEQEFSVRSTAAAAVVDGRKRHSGDTEVEKEKEKEKELDMRTVSVRSASTLPMTKSQAGKGKKERQEGERERDGGAVGSRHGEGTERAPITLTSLRASPLGRNMSSLLAAFELFSWSGPLCEEPVRGVVIVIEDAWIRQGGGGGGGHVQEGSQCGRSSEATSDPYGPLSGQLMSSIKEGCRMAVLQRGRTRLMEAVLVMEMQCQQEVLGKAYGVLAKRRARIVSETLREGTGIFVIQALLPVNESFGIGADLRGRTGGDVSLHLQFSHWDAIDEDPFPEASMTEEEVEEWGETLSAMPPNYARRLLNSVRKRKGLPTEEKVVVAAEKQRTHKMNK